MFWNIVFFIISFWVGFFLFTIGGLQIIIILRCAIPATKCFSQMCKANTKNIYKRCAITIIFWLIVLAALSAVVIFFFGRFVQYGFFIGMIACFVFSFRKCGVNQANLTDYLRVYGNEFDQEDLERVLATQGQNADN